MSRDQLRGHAQTVLGLIDPAALGPTLMHEHLLWDIRTPAVDAIVSPVSAARLALSSSSMSIRRWRTGRRPAASSS